MRRARYLAPWHREGVDWEGVELVGESEGGDGPGQEEGLAAMLAGLRGKPAIYHCVSRIVNKEFVLKREEREKFVGLMRLYERFCQVQVLTFCVMSNHFHILVEVPVRPEDGGASSLPKRTTAMKAVAVAAMTTSMTAPTQRKALRVVVVVGGSSVMVSRWGPGRRGWSY